MALRQFLLALLALILMQPSAQAEDAPSRALAEQLEINRQRYGIAGQALLVTRNGRVLFRGADGEADVGTHEPLTADHVFPGYSLSKLFVSTLVMQLIEQRHVDPEKPASAYVPHLPHTWQAISVRDFLDHSSGLPEYFGIQPGKGAAPAFPEDMQAAFTSLVAAPLLFAPGTDTRYTQTNYLVLAALLESHYGKPYPQVAEERIVRPLDLRHTWLGPAGLPEHGVVTSYLGKDGRLQEDKSPALPVYAYGHGGLYLTLDDLGRFLHAVVSGELVSKDTLRSLWQPRILPNGQRGWFAAGWEYDEVGSYRQLGHDGGARDRVRVLFKIVPDGDALVFVYLTNGSARNVWSRTLVDSAMAALAPEQFPVEALQEMLIRYALQPPTAGDAQAQAKSIMGSSPLGGADLERAVNAAGYAIKENLSVAAALRVFELNTILFPGSTNTWDSLAEAYAAHGDMDKAKALYEKSRRLSPRTEP